MDAGISNSESKIRRRKHASNIEIDKNKSQDDHFQLSEMNELRNSTTSLKVANETLDETIIIDGNRPEADYHNI